MNTVMSQLIEVLNFHSSQYSLIKQGEPFEGGRSRSDRWNFSVDLDEVHGDIPHG